MVNPPAPDTVGGTSPSESAITLQTISALGTQTSEAFHAATHFNDLLRDASRHCRRLVGAAVARIWIARRGGRRLVARDFPAEPSLPPVEHRLARGEGLAGWAVVNEKSIRLGPGDPRPELKGPAQAFRSALVIPLFRRGKAFGAIECLDKERGDAFTDADFDQLEMASEHIAFALDNALLYEETERRALEKEVLLEVSKTISTPLDLEDVIDAIFKSLHQVVDYDAAAIYLVNRGTQAIELVSQIGYPEGSEDAFQVQIGDGIVGRVCASLQKQHLNPPASHHPGKYEG